MRIRAERGYFMIQLQFIAEDAQRDIQMSPVSLALLNRFYTEEKEAKAATH